VVHPNRIVVVKQSVMGKLMDVQMTAADAQRLQYAQREWEAEKQRRAQKARTAMRRYDQTQKERDRKAALRAIGYCSLAERSETRLSPVLHLIEFSPPEIFWPAFMDAWSACDATWFARNWLLRAMKDAGPAVVFLSPAQRKFCEALPAQGQVFRGCSRPRVRAVSWTTDRGVAEGFARGHRGMRVLDPVIASALIPKEHIFFVSNERNEQEVVLNPSRLRKLVIEPVTATASDVP
jgi:hypothetical protein